jgi:hypothetical protein
LALSGHPDVTTQCLLSGVKQTWIAHRGMSANDPKRTSKELNAQGTAIPANAWAIRRDVS